MRKTCEIDFFLRTDFDSRFQEFSPLNFFFWPKCLKLMKFEFIKILVLSILQRFFFRSEAAITLYALTSKSGLLHVSYIQPATVHLRWLDEPTAIEIGGCYTEPSCRGQGLFGEVLLFILSKYPKCNMFMIIDSLNQSSVRASEKSGFKNICSLHSRRSFFRSEYCKINEG